MNRAHAQSCLTLCDPMDCVAHEPPLSMEFSRQESWRGLPLPSPGDLPNSGIKLGSPALQADSLPSEQPGKQRAHEYSLFLQILSLKLYQNKVTKSLSLAGRGVRVDNLSYLNGNWMDGSSNFKASFFKHHD